MVFDCVLFDPWFVCAVGAHLGVWVVVWVDIFVDDCLVFVVYLFCVVYDYLLDFVFWLVC